MTKDICMPDYKNSILNLTNSILKHYGAETKHPSLDELDFLLQKKYKNVVFMIFDGMGSSVLERLLPENSLLRKNKIKDISSVFPCTTTAATTSMYSGLSPKEHGWIAWQCYFEEYNHHVELFTNEDFYTRGKVQETHIANSELPYDHINFLISKASRGRVKTYEIFPAFKEGGVDTIPQLFEKVTGLCQTPEEKFILTYWDDPDYTMHEDGCNSSSVQEIIRSIEKEFASFLGKLKDTIIIVTADHGLIDIERDIFINEMPKLNEYLRFPPSMEDRTMSFYVKPEKKEEFKKVFKHHFQNDFLLFSKDEYIQKFLGPGKAHKKVEDFVGDYVAVAIGKTSLHYQTEDGVPSEILKAHHAGLTSEEMCVPFIVFET